MKYLRNLFTLYTTHFIQYALDQNIKVILTVGANQNTQKGKLDINLSSLALVEAFYNKFQNIGLASYFRVRKQTNDSWESSIISVTNISIFPLTSELDVD